MSVSRIRLGELLVDAGIITGEQLEEVLHVQKDDRRQLGTLLVETGLVTETQVTQILSQQLSVPWVSLYHVDFSRQLLDLVPVELAERYNLVPIFVRRIRGMGNTLYIAMNDPTDEAAREAVEKYAGLPVRVMIAPPTDIRGALRAYYGVGPEPEPIVGSPPAAVAPFPPAPTGSAPTESARAGAVELPAAPRRSQRPPASQSTPPPGSAVDAREAAMPRPKKGSARRMVTLTLLDGSKVTLPARNSKKNRSVDSDPAELDPLTARDILQALRARLHGQDPSEVLGDHGKWEALFTALLSVLLRKQLIADWEFIEELKKL
jgi:type IV pilus assembly protein PilB